MGKTAFVKPLTGSRGDFAQRVHGDAALLTTISPRSSRYYDAILLQTLVAGASTASS